jgi:hypothetical protein
MAAEDRILKILLQLKSDTTGATETTAALKSVQAEAAKTGTLSIADQLKAAGAQLDPLTGAFRSITQESEKAGASWIETGASMSRARNEAVTLVRELATGAGTTRTFGALVGSMGLAIGGASIAVYAIGEGINRWSASIVAAAVEQAKFIDQIVKTEEAILQLAKLADSFSKIVALEEKMVSPLDQLTAKLKDAQIPLGPWKQVLDDLANGLAIMGEGHGAFHPFSDAQKAEVKELEAALIKLRGGFESAAVVADKTKASIDAIKAEPAAQAFNEIGQKISELSREQDTLKQKLETETKPAQFAKIQQAIASNAQEMQLYQGILDEVTKAEEKAADQAQKWSSQLHQIDLGKLDPEDKIKVLQTDLDNANKKLQEMGIDSVEAAIGVYALKVAADSTSPEVKNLATAIAAVIAAERELAGAQRQADRASSAAETREWTAALREVETVIQRIRQQQQLISQNPFLSADQKATASLAAYQQELVTIGTEIAKIQSIQSGGLLNAAQMEQAHQKLQTLGFDFESLKLKIAGLKLPFTSEIVQWANQFDSAVKQMAKALTSTLDTAISGTSQALTGLIFGAKNWQQAFAQAAQSIVQNLIQIALQYVVSKIVMAAIDRVTGQTTGTAATSAASTAAAAWSVAATSAAIASDGAAVTSGVAAYIAGLAVGQTAAIGMSSVGGSYGGGAMEGGYAGDIGDSRVAGFYHGGEYIFSAPAVRNIGVQNLEAAHKSAIGLTSPAAPGSGGGGGGRGGGPVINHAFFIDKRAALNWLKDREGINTLVDVLNANASAFRR